MRAGTTTGEEGFLLRVRDKAMGAADKKAWRGQAGSWEDGKQQTRTRARPQGWSMQRGSAAVGPSPWEGLSGLIFLQEGGLLQRGFQLGAPWGDDSSKWSNRSTSSSVRL